MKNRVLWTAFVRDRREARARERASEGIYRKREARSEGVKVGNVFNGTCLTVRRTEQEMKGIKRKNFKRVPVFFKTFQKRTVLKSRA